MDIGVYISELLARNGEISVPGLGFLVLQKLPGYYNESDGKFYPPRTAIQFDPQQIDDDDTLAQYIAEQKNISPSSAKYFAEKYIAAIREDALVREVHVGDIGSFVADQGRLIFIPAQKPVNNPAFFGLAPVHLIKTLPPPAPIVTPPPAPQPERLFSDFTVPEKPPAYEFNRPTETEDRQNIYQGSTPYPPPFEDTPPSAPPPAAPTRDRQALIDAFNANNKGAYAEQGIPQPPVQNRRPDIFPPVNTPPPVENYGDGYEEEEEHKRPVALFILVGLIVLLALGVFALKKFMPAKFDAIRNIFTHKTAAVPVADAKKSDTVKIKEPEATIPPPALDSAKRDSLNKVHVKDSLRAAKTADSLRKVQRADSIRNAAIRLADDKKRRQDSIHNLQIFREQERKRKADSARVAKAAALAAKEEARKNKKAGTVVIPAPTTAKPTVTVPANTKPAASNVQKTITAAPAATGTAAATAVDPNKTWYATVGGFSSGVADAKIAGLKKIGIDAYPVQKGSLTYVTLGPAFAKNSEAEAAANKYKSKGASDAYVTQIRPSK